MLDRLAAMPKNLQPIMLDVVRHSHVSNDISTTDTTLGGPLTSSPLPGSSLVLTVHVYTIENALRQYRKQFRKDLFIASTILILSFAAAVSILLMHR